MPLYLEPIDVDASIYSKESVLFVICEVCPKMCLSMKENKPYFSLGTLFGKRDFFKDYIAGARKMLEDRGLRTGVFRNAALNAMMCLWPEKQRNMLADFSKGYQAIAVIGCPSAVFTVADAITSPDVPVYPMMRVLGIANFKSKMKLPADMVLQKPAGDFIVKETGLYHEHK